MKKPATQDDFRAKLRVLTQTMTHREIAELFNAPFRGPMKTSMFGVSDIRNWLYRNQPSPKRMKLLKPILDREYKKWVKAWGKEFRPVMEELAMRHTNQKHT